MEALKEMLNFLEIGARSDLKAVSLQYLLDLTGNEEGLRLIVNTEGVLGALLSLLHDRDTSTAKDACLTLVNVSADPNGATALVELEPKSNSALIRAPHNVVRTALSFIVDPNSKLADPCCMILSNVSRPSSLIDKVVDQILGSEVSLEKLVTVFTSNGYNKNAKLHYLGPTFSNLSQNASVRRFLLDKDRCVVQRLLPFTEYPDSALRRGGIVGTLRNCCLDESQHEWLLCEKVDILPRLLLPLAGNEQFDDEDNDKLPIELQYLSEDKHREPDPDIRMMLLEAITQLCAKRCNRTYIRDKNTYVILRELHKWEKDRKALLACENLVDILIKTEDEILHDNIKEVEVPQDLQEKFEKMDSEFLQDSTT